MINKQFFGQYYYIQQNVYYYIVCSSYYRDTHRDSYNVEISCGVRAQACDETQRGSIPRKEFPGSFEEMKYLIFSTLVLRIFWPYYIDGIRKRMIVNVTVTSISISKN